jgi:peptide/nickel transport system permease protein
MSPGLGYVARRLGAGLLLLFLLSIITFLIYFAVPSEPAAFLVDPQKATPAQLADARHRLGVDRPVYVQYVRFVERAVRGDFGIAYQSGQYFYGRGDAIHVGRTLLRAAAVTGSVVLGGALLLLLVAVPLGTLAAARPGSLLDRGAGAASLAGISTHPLVVALLLQLFVARRWHLAPATDYCDFFPRTNTAARHEAFGATVAGVCSGPLAWASHLVLPWIVFALFFVALYMRMTRTNVLEALGQPYVRTARAKGAPEKRVLVRHALPNAFPPLLTMVGMDVGTAIGIAIYIEVVFGLPGLGRLALGALGGGVGYDLPMIVGLVMVTGLAIILINLVIDLVYPLLDPRVLDEPRRRMRFSSALGRA